MIKKEIIFSFIVYVQNPESLNIFREAGKTSSNLSENIISTEELFEIEGIIHSDIFTEVLFIP